ncbi:MAG: hypothetical protein PHQ43_09075 [Dehalococcoidales bacterium]|nr:hypothetical protein [Dehalococcoidales bacterium]
MPKLRVTRRGHYRDAHMRPGGVVVPRRKIKKVTFLIKDRGAPGRTPKEDRFFHPKVHTGWEADMPAKKRRGLMLKAHGGNALSTARALQALHNVSFRTAPAAAAKAQADAKFFYRKHKAEK